MKNIIWLSGMPRSGTTWLSQIYASSPDVRLKFCPLFSYEFKNLLDEESDSKAWNELFNDVYLTNSDFLDQEYLRREGLVPHFIKKNDYPNNLVIKSTRFHNLTPSIMKLNQDMQFIHIVRDPCASIYSWLNNPYEFPAIADANKEWLNGDCRKTGIGEFWGFNDWLFTTQQALELENKYPARFKVIRYEDLMESPQTKTKALFEFSNINYHEQTKDFLLLSHSKHDQNKRSVFKDPKLANSWEEHLSPSIIKEIHSTLKGKKMERFSSIKILDSND